MGYLWNFRITSIVRVTGLRVIGLDKQSRTYSSAGNESKEETESCRDLVALGSRLKDAVRLTLHLLCK